MKKVLSLALALIMVLSLTVTVLAVDDPSIDNFGSSGWDSSYDASTKTITYNGDWTGRGWWFSNETPVEGLSSITINFASNENGCQVNVEYANGAAENTSTPCKAGELTVTAPIAAAPVAQIYIQTYKAGTIVLDSVSVTHTGDDAPVEDNEPVVDIEPVEDTTPVETPVETPVKNTTSAPAKTGVVLAVLPMAIAAAAVVVSKKR